MCIYVYTCIWCIDKSNAYISMFQGLMSILSYLRYHDDPTFRGASTPQSLKSNRGTAPTPPVRSDRFTQDFLSLISEEVRALTTAFTKSIVLLGNLSTSLCRSLITSIRSSFPPQNSFVIDNSPHITQRYQDDVRDSAGGFSISFYLRLDSFPQQSV